MGAPLEGALLGRGGGLLLRLRGGLAALGSLHAETLGEPLDASLGVHQLLAAREERVAVVTDLEVQLRLRGPGLPVGAAGAPGLDVEILGVNPFLLSFSLGTSGKRQYTIPVTY